MKEPRPIGDFVRAVLRDSGVLGQSGDERIFRAWNAAAGPELAQRAVPVRFRRGVLTVEVSSSAHLHELKSFTGETLRKQVAAELKGGLLRKVVFRLKG